MMEEEVILKVTDLCKWFPIRQSVRDRIEGRAPNHVKAVDFVSFKLKRGENLGIVGESGCGKSTLARTIMRLYEPTRGRIEVNGRNVTNLSFYELRSARNKMQMIFQDPYSSLDPKMTVYQTLEEMLRVHKNCPVAWVPDRIRELLAMTGLSEEAATRYPGEFSGGQRQRICIARALASDPEFIIADEPVSALDVSIQAQILNLLNKLQKELNLTVIFISHDLDVIRYISDRVLVMYLGSVAEEGPTAEVFQRPLHPYSEVLTKAIPVLDPRKRTDKSAIEGELPSPIHMPEGCRFHPRCPYCQEKCRRERPELRDMGDGRKVACHYPLQQSEDKK